MNYLFKRKARQGDLNSHGSFVPEGLASEASTRQSHYGHRRQTQNDGPIYEQMHDRFERTNSLKSDISDVSFDNRSTVSKATIHSNTSANVPRFPQKHTFAALKNELEIEDDETDDQNVIQQTSIFSSVNILVRGDFFSSTYKIGERLGSGVCSSVFVGILKDTGEKYCVKKLSKAFLESEKDMNLIKKEISAITFPPIQNIPKIYQLFDEDNGIFFVQKYVQGKNVLTSLAVSEKYTEFDARKIILQLLEIVETIHSHDLVHKDIKPENLKLTTDNKNQLILLDFGFGKTTSNTNIVKVLNNFDYVAPEILRGEEATDKADVWSICALTFTLLGGYSAFYNWNKWIMSKNIQQGYFLLPRSHWGSVSKDAIDFVCRGLVVDVDQRANINDLINHPWINMPESQLLSKNLAKSQSEMRKFMFRRRFRSAIKALILINKLSEGNFDGKGTIEHFPMKVVSDGYLMKDALDTARSENAARQERFSLSNTNTKQQHKVRQKVNKNQIVEHGDHSKTLVKINENDIDRFNSSFSSHEDLFEQEDRMSVTKKNNRPTNKSPGAIEKKYEKGDHKKVNKVQEMFEFSKDSDEFDEYDNNQMHKNIIPKERRIEFSKRLEGNNQNMPIDIVFDRDNHRGSNHIMKNTRQINVSHVKYTIEEIERIIMTTETNITTYIERVLQSDDLPHIKEEFRLLLQKYDLLKSLNAQQLMKIHSMQGNIQVFCRIRPLLNSEQDDVCVEMLSDTEVGLYETRQKQWRSFGFDRVWGSDSTQQDVFQELEPLTLSVVNGYNSCIFAYGQTGSGKTFTMIGDPDRGQFGLAYRITHKIFDILAFRESQMNNRDLPVGGENDMKNNFTNLALAQKTIHQTAAARLTNYGSFVPEGSSSDFCQFRYFVKVAMVEIYNEQVRDLLVSPLNSTASQSLEIKRKVNDKMEIPGLTFEDVKNWHDVVEVFRRGTEGRSTSSTDLNLHSSRSHCILIIDITTIVKEGTPIEGRMYLVDLAGSENVNKSNVSGDGLREAKFINKSLSALGDVMEALDKKSAHVPYRNSQLTYLLQDALGGGNSRTAMLLAIRPSSLYAQESQYALQFATRVRKINLPPARVNLGTKNIEENLKAAKAQIDDMTKEKKQLEKELKNTRNECKQIENRFQQDAESGMRGMEQRMRELQNEIEALQSTNAALEKRFQREQDAKITSSDQFTAQIDKLRGEFLNLNSENKVIQTKLKEALDREQSLQRQKNQSDIKIKNLEASISKLETDISSMQRSNSSLSSQLKQETQEREDKVAEKIREIWALQEHNQALQDEIDNLNRELSKQSHKNFDFLKVELETKIRSTQIRAKELEMETDSLKRTNETLLTQLQKIQQLNQDRVIQLNNENSLLQREIQRKDEEIKGIMDRLMSIQTKTGEKHFEAEVVALRAINADLSSRLQNEKNAAEQKVTELQNSLWEHKEQLVEISRERDDLAVKIHELEMRSQLEKISDDPSLSLSAEIEALRQALLNNTESDQVFKGSESINAKKEMRSSFSDAKSKRRTRSPQTGFTNTLRPTGEQPHISTSDGSNSVSQIGRASLILHERKNKKAENNQDNTSYLEQANRSFYKLLKIPAQCAGDLLQIVNEINTNNNLDLSIAFQDGTTSAKYAKYDKIWSWALLSSPKRSNDNVQPTSFSVLPKSFTKSINVQLLYDNLNGTEGVCAGVIRSVPVISQQIWHFAHGIEEFVRIATNDNCLLVEARPRSDPKNHGRNLWVLFTNSEENGQKISNSLSKYVHKLFDQYPVLSDKVDETEQELSDFYCWDVYQEEKCNQLSGSMQNTISTKSISICFEIDINTLITPEIISLYNQPTDRESFFKLFKLPLNCIDEINEIIHAINQQYGRNLALAIQNKNNLPRPINNNLSSARSLLYDNNPNVPRFAKYLIQTTLMDSPIEVELVYDKLHGNNGVFVGIVNGVPAKLQNWWLFALVIEEFVRKLIADEQLIVEARIRFIPENREFKWVIFTDTEENSNKIRDAFSQTKEKITNLFSVNFHDSTEFSSNFQDPEAWDVFGQAQSMNIEQFELRSNKFFNLFKIPKRYSDKLVEIIEDINNRYAWGLSLSFHDESTNAKPANLYKVSNYCWALLYQNPSKSNTNIIPQRIIVSSQINGMDTPINLLLVRDKLAGAAGKFVGELLGVPTDVSEWWITAERIEDFIRQISGDMELVIEVRLRFNSNTFEYLWGIYTDNDESSYKIEQALQKNLKFSNYYIVSLEQQFACHLIGSINLARAWEIYEQDEDIAELGLKYIGFGIDTDELDTTGDEHCKTCEGNSFFKLFKIPIKYVDDTEQIVEYINRKYERNLVMSFHDNNFVPKSANINSEWSWCLLYENNQKEVPYFSQYELQLESMETPITVTVTRDKLQGADGIFVGQLFGIPLHLHKWWMRASTIESFVKKIAGDSNLILEARLRYSPVTQEYTWALYSDNEKNLVKIRETIKQNQLLIDHKYDPHLKEEIDNQFDNFLTLPTQWEIYEHEEELAEPAMKYTQRSAIEITDEIKQMDSNLTNEKQTYFKIFKLPSAYANQLPKVLEIINKQYSRQLSIGFSDNSTSAWPANDGSQWSWAVLHEHRAKNVPRFAKYMVQTEQMIKPIEVQVVLDKLDGNLGIFVGLLIGLPACPKKWWWCARVIEAFIREIVGLEDLIVEARLRYRPACWKYIWVILTHTEENAILIQHALINNKKKFQEKFEIALSQPNETEYFLRGLWWDLYEREEQLAEIQNTGMPEEVISLDQISVQGSGHFKMLKLPLEYANELSSILEILNTRHERNFKIAFKDGTTFAKPANISQTLGWALLTEEKNRLVPRYARYKIQTQQMDAPVYIQIIKDRLCGASEVFVGILKGPSTSTRKWWWTAIMIERFIIRLVNSDELLVEARLRYVPTSQIYEWILLTNSKLCANKIEHAFEMRQKTTDFRDMIQFPLNNSVHGLELIQPTETNSNLSNIYQWEIYEREEIPTETQTTQTSSVPKKFKLKIQPKINQFKETVNKTTKPTKIEKELNALDEQKSYESSVSHIEKQSQDSHVSAPKKATITTNKRSSSVGQPKQTMTVRKTSASPSLRKGIKNPSPTVNTKKPSVPISKSSVRSPIPPPKIQPRINKK